MSEDIHDTEDFFRSRLDPNFEEPSEEVWDKLNARLDKELADTYKKKFFALKRVAIVLLMSLIFFALFEAIFVKQTFTRQATETQPNRNSSNKSDEVRLEEKGNNSLDDQAGKNRQPPLVNSKTTGDDRKNYDYNNDHLNGIDYSIVAHKKTKKDNQHSLTDQYDTAYTMIGKSKSYFTDKQRKISADSRIHPFTQQLQPLHKEGIESNHAIVLPMLPDDRLIIRNAPQSTGIQPESPVSTAGVKIKINQAVKSNEAIKITQFHRSWSFAAFGSHEWTDYNLEDDEPDNRNVAQKDDKDEIKHREEHEPSYHIGVLATYQLTRRTAVQTGIIFESSNISVHPQELHAYMDVNGKTGYKYNVSSGYIFVNPSFGRNPAVGDSLAARGGQHTLSYVSIPLILKRIWSFKKITISPGAGLTANFLTGASIKTEIEDGIRREEVNLTRIQGIRNFYAGIMANAPINYSITRSFGISLVSSFNYALMPITKRNVVKTYPFSVGVGIGLTYKP